MNPIANDNPARTLRPVASHFDKSGAPILPLSPTRGLRNASTIYEKIKTLPDQTAIRADYDRSGKPYMYFPRTKKHSIQTSHDMLGTANEQADRQEVLSILQSIAQDVQTQSGSTQEARLAAIRFGLMLRQRSLLGDIRVGDVREALATFVGAEAPTDGKTRARGSVLRAQLANFVGMPLHLKKILASTLETGRTAASTPYICHVDAVFKLVQEFLTEQPQGSARTFLSHVGHYPLSADLIRFAWQWRKLKADGKATAGSLFRQMPWAKHIDFVTRVIRFVAERVGRWQAPDPVSTRMKIRSMSSSAAAFSESVVSANSTTTSTVQTPARSRGTAQPQPQPQLQLQLQRAQPSLSTADLTSDVGVLSSPIPRADSRVLPFVEPEEVSSDARVMSPMQADADAAASSSLHPTKSRARIVREEDSDETQVSDDGQASDDVESTVSVTSVRSLLYDVDWVPFGNDTTEDDEQH